MRVLRTTLAVAGASVAVLCSAAVSQAATATKPPGYVRVDSGAIANPNGQATPGQVTCPAGTVVWGGGTGFSFGFAGLGDDINTSSPTGTGWRAVYNNRSGFPQQFHVGAVCAKQPAGYTFSFASVTIADGGQSNATAVCPPGTVVLSGGSSTSSTSPGATVLSSFPLSQTKYRTFMANHTGASMQLNTFAMCAQKPPKYRIVSGVGTDPGGPSSDAGGSQCPAGTSVIGGGIKITGPRPLITIGESTALFNDEWDVTVVDDAPGAATETFYGICAA